MRAVETGARITALLAALAVSAGTAPPADAADVRDQSRRLTAVKAWQMTLRYRMDIAYENNPAPQLSSSESYNVEADGTVLFTRSRRRGWYQGDGEVKFSLEYSSLAQMGDYRILDVERGAGTAPILPEIEISYLRFELDTFTYSFDLLPGEEMEGDFGVRSRSFRRDNITETVLREMQEAGSPVPFPELIRQWAPPERTWDEFTSTFSVSAFQIPLPFFGLRLSGSYTDPAGGVVTWILEPADGTEETFTSEEEPEIPGLEATESWVHYHPPSADEREEMTSAWVPIREGIEEEASGGSGGGAGTGGPASGFQLFMVSPRGTGPATGCGDSLQPVTPTSEKESSGDTPGRVIGELEDADSAPGEPGNPVLAALLSRLLSTPAPAGSSDLRNVAAEHDLFLAGLAVSGGRAQVQLSDMVVEYEECDARRVVAQVRHTALQLADVTEVQVVVGAREVSR